MANVSLAVRAAFEALYQALAARSSRQNTYYFQLITGKWPTHATCCPCAGVRSASTSHACGRGYCGASRFKPEQELAQLRHGAEQPRVLFHGIAIGHAGDEIRDPQRSPRGVGAVKPVAPFGRQIGWSLDV